MTIYAIKKDNKILVHTIAQWRRAAIVAFLLEDARQRVFCNDTDATVEDLWDRAANGAQLIEVTVEETKKIVAFEKYNADRRPVYDEGNPVTLTEPNFIPLHVEKEAEQ
jgi:hypothetical protein